jgi:formate-dependent nitrite reductase membrane component NrfD
MALLAGALGSIVAGYSGTLLAATAVPLWSKRPAILGPLFLASAMTSGAAAVSAAAALMGATDDSAHDNLRRFEMMSAVSEGALLVAWLAALGPTARPIATGHLGAVVRQGTGGAGIAAPLLIGAVSRHLPQRLRCPANLAASALTLLGVLALRYAVMEGGRQSADDAEATFEMTR